MKSLHQFIIENEIQNLNEALLSKLSGWFKNLFKSQETLQNKTIKTDIKQIKGPEKPTKLKDIEANKEELKLINDPKVGFPITASLIKQKNKYLVKENEDGSKEEYEPLINRYFYVDGSNKYDIGIIMFDEKIKNDNNYVNLLNIEVIKQVENKDEVIKFINKIFEDSMKKKSFKGAQYISKNTAVKGTIIRLGYSSQNNNNEIMFKNFK